MYTHVYVYLQDRLKVYIIEQLKSQYVVLQQKCWNKKRVPHICTLNHWSKEKTGAAFIAHNMWGKHVCVTLKWWLLCCRSHAIACVNQFIISRTQALMLHIDPFIEASLTALRGHKKTTKAHKHILQKTDGYPQLEWLPSDKCLTSVNTSCCTDRLSVVYVSAGCFGQSLGGCSRQTGWLCNFF